MRSNFIYICFFVGLMPLWVSRGSNIYQTIFNNPNYEDENGYTMLMMTCVAGDINTVKLLLNIPGVDLNHRHIKTNETALSLAIMGKKDNIGALLAADSRMNVNFVYPSLRKTVLHLAIEYDQINTIKALLKNKNLNINLTDSGGYTPLMWAVFTNKNAIISLILQHPDIDVNLKNCHGDTALMLAIEMGYLRIVKTLLGFPKIKVNLRNNKQKTALMSTLCAKHGRFLMMKELVNTTNIGLSIQNNNGNTALMFVAKAVKNKKKEEYRGEFKQMAVFLLFSPKMNLNLEKKALKDPFIQSISDKLVERYCKKVYNRKGMIKAIRVAILYCLLGVWVKIN